MRKTLLIAAALVAFAHAQPAKAISAECAMDAECIAMSQCLKSKEVKGMSDSDKAYHCKGKQEAAETAYLHCYGMHLRGATRADQKAARDACSGDGE